MTVRRDQRECFHAATPSGDVVSVTRCVGEGWDLGVGDDRMLWVSDEGVAALRDMLCEAVPSDAERHPSTPGLRKALDLVHGLMEELREKRGRAKAIGHDRKVHALAEQIGALYDLGARLVEALDAP